MLLWTCPNVECTYDMQLEPGERCPLCGEKAEGFDFSNFGGIMKKKWSLKKSMVESKKQEAVLRRTKTCPKCGSTNINPLAFYRPSAWKCLDCGHEGVPIMEDNRLAERAERRHKN